jgi:GT2 family glycosyltransferase
VRRYCAIGDIIMASGVARKLAPVTLQCHPRVAELFAGDNEVKAVGWHPGPDAPGCHIDLDMSYEGHVDQMTVPTQVLMARKAGLSDFSNLTPVLVASEDIRARVRQDWGHLPRPWIVVCPRSQMSRARTVSDFVWEMVPDGRTWFWIGIHVAAPKGFTHVNTDDLKYMLALLAEADLLVTVDSGPMHMAAAVGTPLVAITQSYRSDLQLTDQRDFRMVGRTDLTCLNCHERFCPIDRENPPCGMVDPKMIRDAANAMIQAYSGDAITAVIPVYKPKVARLEACIEYALKYVQEIVVSIDGDGVIPRTTFNGDPRIKWVSNPTGQRRGYGKTCNFGARHANGRFLLFLNDDVYLQPDTISKMKAAIQPDRVGGVGCLLRYPDGTLQHAGTGRSDGLVGYGHLDWKQINPTIKQLTEIENVTHACFLVRREAFYDVLGYDERFDTYWEDNDLNLKLRQKGWKIMYEPNAWAIHEEHQTTDATGRTNEFYEHGKKLFEDKWRWYFRKNPSNQLGTFV